MIDWLSIEKIATLQSWKEDIEDEIGDDQDTVIQHVFLLEIAIKRLEEIKTAIEPYRRGIEKKGVGAFGYVFSERNTKVFDFSKNKDWQGYQLNIEADKQFQKELETLLKTDFAYFIETKKSYAIIKK